ncbi:MAG TPA: ADOP family duplicated permease [Gemmatimonadaceae bacterium]|jgi:predicted permease|nr:ADOP family duplicated permease [Gemmatimonadaceae bacterium]
MLRSLLRSRAFTAASTTTIALSVAAACTVFALLNAVLLRPLPYAHADRLVGMWHTLPGVDVPVAKQSLGTYTLYRESAKSFEATGVYVALPATIDYPNTDIAAERVRGAWMTPTMLDVLGARPLFGRPLTNADAATGETPAALISERLWRTRFGADRAVTERSIDLDGRRYRIAGVMPASFAFPETRTLVWTSLDASNPVYLGSFGFDGIGRLRPGVTPDAAQRELARILPRAVERFPEQRPAVSTALVLRQARMAPVVHALRDDVVAGFDRVLWLIAGAVVLLVVVAFSNVASLQLVRVEARSRELAVRRALGASTAAIWGGLMGESTAIAAAGAMIGLFVAALAVDLLVRAAPLNVPRLNEVRVDGPVAGVAAALLLLFAVSSALIGMMRALDRDTLSTLRDSARSVTGGRFARRLRAAFVGVEVAMSLALLAGAGVLGRSIERLRAVNPGFDASNVFTFWTFLPGSAYHHREDLARFYADAIARIRALPGVVSVAATAKLPLEVEGFHYRVAIWGDDGSESSAALPPVVQATTTTSGYFDTMRIPIIAGRSYDDETVRRGAFEAVVSRKYVDAVWHDATGGSGVGKRVRSAARGPWFTVVGVVDDVRDSTLTQPPVAEVYFPEQPNGDTTVSTTAQEMAFVVRTRGPAPALPNVLRNELRALDPNLPFHRPATMQQVLEDSRATMTFALIVLGVGAAAASLLGIVGLYGSVAYVVSLRTREISIRIALGLDPAAAPRLMLREGAAVVACGVLAGLLVFLAASRLLASLTFEVRPNDPIVIAGAVAGVIAIAAGAIWTPASRAARVKPAEALSAD